MSQSKAEEAGERGGNEDGLPDYAGPFKADFRYEDLSREALVRLVRE